MRPTAYWLKTHYPKLANTLTLEQEAALMSYMSPRQVSKGRKRRKGVTQTSTSDCYEGWVRPWLNKVEQVAIDNERVRRANLTHRPPKNIGDYALDHILNREVPLHAAKTCSTPDSNECNCA